MNSNASLATRPGPEDLAILRLKGKDVLFTANASRRLIGMNRKAPAIKSHVIGLGDPTFQVAWEGGKSAGGELVNDCPLGIAVRPGGMEASLYSVSTDHPRFPKRGRVCVFEATAPGQVRPLWQTPWHADFKHTNGIAVTAGGEIYVSTFGLLQTHAKPVAGQGDGKSAEHAIYRYCRGDKSWHRVATGINGANGLALTEGDTHLLVCSYHDKGILAFALNPSSAALTGEPVSIRPGLTFHPDNLKALGGNRFAVAGPRSFAAVIPRFLFGHRSVGLAAGGEGADARDGAHVRNPALHLLRVQYERREPSGRGRRGTDAPLSVVLAEAAPGGAV